MGSMYAGEALEEVSQVSVMLFISTPQIENNSSAYTLNKNLNTQFEMVTKNRMLWHLVRF